jgi:hypothetical protein
MITLFVVQSCADAKDPSETIASWGGVASEVHQVASLGEINSTDRVNDWYAVIYDNERIDEPLLEGLKVFVEQSEADVLVLYRKKDDTGSKSPRIFRRNITLGDNTLMPEQDVIFETVLNGWVHDIS